MVLGVKQKNANVYVRLTKTWKTKVLNEDKWSAGSWYVLQQRVVAKSRKRGFNPKFLWPWSVKRWTKPYIHLAIGILILIIFIWHLYHCTPLLKRIY